MKVYTVTMSYVSTSKDSNKSYPVVEVLGVYMTKELATSALRKALKEMSLPKGAVRIDLAERELEGYQTNKEFFDEQIRMILEVEKNDTPEKFTHLSDDDIEKIIADVITSVNDDDNVFETIDDSIRYGIYNHKLMLGGQK